MNTRKMFYPVWLLAGLVQLGLTGCGAGTPANADTLLSSGPNTASNDGAGTAQENNGLFEGIRFSRAFFEGNLSGSVRVQSGDGQTVLDSKSAVDLEELPPTDPAPKGQYLADFRDRLNCAGYTDLNGMRFCFNTSPDVSTITLNAKKADLQGAEEYLNEQLKAGAKQDCGKYVQNIRYGQAVKDNSTLKVTYLADGTTGQEGCNLSPMMITLEIQKI